MGRHFKKILYPAFFCRPLYKRKILPTSSQEEDQFGGWLCPLQSAMKISMTQNLQCVKSSESPMSFLKSLQIANWTHQGLMWIAYSYGMNHTLLKFFPRIPDIPNIEINCLTDSFEVGFLAWTLFQHESKQVCKGKSK